MAITGCRKLMYPNKAVSTIIQISIINPTANEAVQAQWCCLKGLITLGARHLVRVTRPYPTKRGKRPTKTNKIMPGNRKSRKGDPLRISGVKPNNLPLGSRKSIGPLIRAPIPIKNIKKIRKSEAMDIDGFRFSI
jgi:hypothetical protein